MSAITAKASRKMKKYAVLTREPRCFLGSFDFSWEQRKLGDIGKARSGVGFPDADQGGLTGVPFFKVSDMNSDGNENEMTVANNYVTTEQIADHRWSPITELPAIFFAKVGAAVMLNRKRLCRFPFLLDNNTMAYSLSPTKWDADFAKALFGTVDLTSLVQVGALPSYNAGDVESMEIYLPSLLEQEQIGAYFKHLDNLITLHQRKCALLFSSFQALISMMFTTSTFSWEQRKLGDISEIKTGPFGSTLHADDYVSDGTPIITTEHFKTGTLPRSKNGLPQVSDADYKRLTAYTLDDGDIVFSRVGSVDINALITPFQSNWLFSGRVLRVRPQTNISSQFLHTRLETGSIKADIRARAVGQTMPSINTEILKITPLVLPTSAAEQEQIGSYFAAIDNLITLHQRKCISFTGRAGRLISTVNKKRITSSWEQRKLGDIGETYTGLSGKTKADFGHGQARFVTYMNVFSNPISNPEMTEPIEIDPKQNEVEVGDVFFTTSSETPEEVGMSSVLLEKRGKTYLNSFCFGFRPSEKIDSYYLAYMLRSESAREKIILLAQGISRYNISKNKVMEIAVSLPSLDEQKLIGQYFRQLDNLITLHQRKPFLMKWRTSDANRNQTNRLVL